jgi:hypothetical protein
MPSIALPAFHITTTKKHALEFPHALQQDLEAYRAFYKQTYGADVNEPDLIREIVRAFLAHDEAFRGFRTGVVPRSRSRARGGRSGAGEGTPANGNGSPPALVNGRV